MNNFIPSTTHSGNNTAGNLSRLLSAAVINRGFRDLLLTQPEEALQRGYLGEKFNLNREELRRVISIQARDLADFARQLSTAGEKPQPVCSGCWFPVNQTTAVLDAE